MNFKLKSTKHTWKNSSVNELSWNEVRKVWSSCRKFSLSSQTSKSQVSFIPFFFWDLDLFVITSSILWGFTLYSEAMYVFAILHFYGGLLSKSEDFLSFLLSIYSMTWPPCSKRIFYFHLINSFGESIALVGHRQEVCLVLFEDEDV